MKYMFIIFILLVFAGCSSVSVNTNPQNQGGTGIISEDYLFAVSGGEIPNAFIVHKFGANDNVGNTLEPVALSGNYRTPTTAQSLEILSSDADDTAGGLGARKVKVIGLNASGDEIEEEITLNGLTPVSLTNNFLRVYRMYVSESGTYANQTAGSHQGILTLRASGGGVTWAIITIEAGFGVGQTEIGAYTVPKDTECYLLHKVMSVNSNKVADLYFFRRENINQTTAPYTAMRLVEKHIGLIGIEEITSRSSIAKFSELTDIGFLATATTSAEVSVEFELLCERNS